MPSETTRGPEVPHGKRVLIPVAKAVRHHLPGGAAGFVWNHPFGLVVKDDAGSRFLRVPDWTRRIQWSLLAAGLAAGMLARLLRR
jgi:hypothetical protein